MAQRQPHYVTVSQPVATHLHEGVRVLLQRLPVLLPRVGHFVDAFIIIRVVGHPMIDTVRRKQNYPPC